MELRSIICQKVLSVAAHLSSTRSHPPRVKASMKLAMRAAHVLWPYRPTFRITTAIAPTFVRNCQHRQLSTTRHPQLRLLSRPFSTSTPLLGRKKKKGAAAQGDTRITAIRYFLQHPKIPRPLRFSRNRALRHWTIHRAWQLHCRRQRTAKENELQRQYTAMRRACEALRLLDESGCAVTEGAGRADVGRLYRAAMDKKGVWGPNGGVPIEYARAQTEFPSREGWNHDWTR